MQTDSPIIHIMSQKIAGLKAYNETKMPNMNINARNPIMVNPPFNIMRKILIQLRYFCNLFGVLTNASPN